MDLSFYSRAAASLTELFVVGVVVVVVGGTFFQFSILLDLFSIFHCCCCWGDLFPNFITGMAGTTYL